MRTPSGPKIGPAQVRETKSACAVVVLPVLGGPSLDFAQLRSEDMRVEDADRIAKEINRALKKPRKT